MTINCRTIDHFPLYGFPPRREAPIPPPLPDLSQLPLKSQHFSLTSRIWSPFREGLERLARQRRRLASPRRGLWRLLQARQPAPRKDRAEHHRNGEAAEHDPQSAWMGGEFAP